MRFSLSTEVQQNTHTAPGSGAEVGACAGVCEIRNAGNDLTIWYPGDAMPNRATQNPRLADIACCNVLGTGVNQGPVLQKSFRGCWNVVRKIGDFSVHQAFARVKVEIGRCDVCGTGKAVYRSREAQAKVCEERLSLGPEFEHRKVRGRYTRLVWEWNGREGVR